MAMEALSSNDLFNFIIYDTISATSFSCNDSISDTANFLLENLQKSQEFSAAATLNSSPSLMTPRSGSGAQENVERRQNLAVQGRKKRRRRPKVCKNKEEAETQRMTHIAVERNRRKQMNEHLAVLRSLMPESYVQRGDQASIVGGAIDFVKELEHLLQSLEVQKFLLVQEGGARGSINETTTTTTTDSSTAELLPTPFAQFFAYPQYSCSQMPNKYSSCSRSHVGITDVEVTLIESHANIRIVSRKRLRQLSRIVAGLQTIYLTILHLNVTALDPLVLYSISAKVEEGCQLNSADDIAAAVQHMFRIMEEESVSLPYANDQS